ncbi:MAG TPA: S8 family serine peptidase [Thermoanaerobaculia bacterium]|nr:S8 family serine peptidase [Thermoanaerobaculia bacterium]
MLVLTTRTLSARTSRRPLGAPARILLLLGAGLPVWAGWPGAATAAVQARPPVRLAASAQAQIEALRQEKLSRTAAQRKMDSRLLFAIYHQRKRAALAAVPSLRIAAADPDGKILVDVDALALTGMKVVVRQLRAIGADIEKVSFSYRSIRTRVPLAQAEALAALPEVRRIDLARQAVLSAGPRAGLRAGKGPGASNQTAGPRPRRPLARRAGAKSGPAETVEGDAVHRAAEARSFFGASGAGVKICVLSDGIDSVPSLQTSGDLPPVIDVLPGQAGSGDEGTALLEVVHDLAPGASLGFATAFGGEPSFAQNIRDLRSALGCDVIVDDVLYLRETPFQDLDVAESVNAVTAAGALYFSSAGNEGNLDAATSGTWEGDFKPNGNLDPVLGPGAGPTHDFGDGGQSDLVTGQSVAVTLHWADPFNTACDDYDLYVLSGDLTSVLDASTNTQDCSPGSDPFEATAGASPGERIVVTKFNGAGVMIHVEAPLGTVALATAGCTYGHGSAADAFAVAAAPAAAGFAAGQPAGPFPGPFTSSQRLETFTCDGPRRIFFDNAGHLLSGATPGNVSSTGGFVRLKPDITAADGVSSDTPGFSPFFGTSAAVAHAAAIAGLLKSAAPAATPLDIRRALVRSAITVGTPFFDRNSGVGIVMAYQALQAIGATPKAVLGLGAVTPVQAAGNGDAVIDTGEDWSLALTLVNLGGGAASAISATLSTTTPGVVILQPTSAYPDLLPGGGASGVTPFAFTPLAAPCGTVIHFTLTVTLSGGASPQTFPFTLQTGQPGTPVKTSYTGPPVPIPDGLGAEQPGPAAVVPLTLSGIGGRIIHLAFSLDGTACTTDAGATTVGVDHTLVRDLVFDLKSPAGTVVTVISRIDLDGHNFCQVVLDDGSPGPSIESAASGQAPFTGSWQPNAPLAAFLGEDPNGTWELHATDHFMGDTGSIRAFSITVTPAVCSPVSLAAAVTATKAVSGFSAGAVTYTVVLRNGGSGAQLPNPGDEFTDTLPPTLTLLSATATAGTVTTSGNTVHWSGAILAGAAVTITITAQINAAAGQIVANQGVVSFDPGRTGTNGATAKTNDPSQPGSDNPTAFVVAVAEVPTLSPLGLALLALALLGGGLVHQRWTRIAGLGVPPEG